MNFKKQLKDGLIYQNPVLVQVLGMCSTMAITTSISNGVGMGISVLIILTLSNIFISLLIIFNYTKGSKCFTQTNAIRQYTSIIFFKFIYNPLYCNFLKFI